MTSTTPYIWGMSAKLLFFGITAPTVSKPRPERRDAGGTRTVRRSISVAVVLLVRLVLCSAVHSAEFRDLDDWPMYGRNLQHTFSNPDSRVTPNNVARLQPAWVFSTGDAVTASPAVVDGVVYTGSWDGYFYAIDAGSGQLRWKFRLDCQMTVVPIPEVCGGPPSGTADPRRFTTPGGIATASPALSDGKLYFAGGKTLYAVKASDGTLLWKRVICGRPEENGCASDSNDPTQILSSPAVFDGKIFVGVDTGGVEFDIPYRGGFVALDAKTGESIWRFEVDPRLDPKGHVARVQNRGCGNVWSSPAIDPRLRLVFFGTADCEDQPLPPYHGSVLALDTDTGHIRWVFRPRETDPNKCDFDFGASPNVIDVADKKYVGIGGKDGTYYLLDRLTGRPSWARRVVFGGGIGGFFGAAAFDGHHIFSATAFGDGNITRQTGLCDPNYHDPANPNVVDTFIQNPSMHAFDAATGTILWEENNNQSLGATTLADRVVFSGFMGTSPSDLPAVKAYDARRHASGNRLLFVFPTQVNGRPGMVDSAVVPVGRMIVFGSGNFFDGSASGIHALILP
jgi:outer membrane protein assembly factor BamB